ncbi:MAG TPA: glycosyltransferase, partial [Anaerovoracaceae bacterium]|nr:glycosyltransferase [Anaerovoracaceae bacterium]
MRVLMTGGGTGGHIYPAIAIADRIKKEHKDAEILFVGTERGLEKSIVPKSGYDIKFIKVRGFNRKNVLKNIKVLLELPKAFKDAKNIIKAFNPDIVIGTGGYVCGPVVRIAHKLGVKTYIHEQNAFPGLTNKLLEKYVDKIFIGFKEAEKNFRHKEKIVLSGNPVRSEFEHLDKSECRKKLGIPDKDFAILAFGGS